MGGASTDRRQWRDGCRGDTDVGGGGDVRDAAVTRSRDDGEAAITARGDVREAPVTTGRPCRRGTCDGAPMSARRPLRRSGGCGEAAVTARWRLRRGGAYSELTRWAMADFLLAAWLRWMTPLLTALSSCRDAMLNAACARSWSSASAASRKWRTAVFSDDLTLLLRIRAFSLVRLRLIWDLMFATKQPRRWYGQVIAHSAGMRCRDRSSPSGGQPHEPTSGDYQRPTSDQSGGGARVGMPSRNPNQRRGRRSPQGAKSDRRH